jgi:hypothetical protein
MFRYLVMVVLLISSLYAKADYIEATGYGNTKDEALKSAFSDAVSQYIGVVVDSKSIVKHGKLIEDKILTFSNGYIKHYKLISATHKVGLWQVKIKALVKEQKIMKKIITEKISAKNITNGDQRYARLASQIKTKFDAEDILVATMKELLSWNTNKKYLQPTITKFFIDEDGATRKYVPIYIVIRKKVNKYAFNSILNRLRVLFKKLGAKKMKYDEIHGSDWVTVIKINNLNNRKEYWKFPNSYKVIYPFVSKNFYEEGAGWYRYLKDEEVDTQVAEMKDVQKKYIILFLDKKGKILKSIMREVRIKNDNYDDMFYFDGYNSIKVPYNNNDKIFNDTIKIPLSMIKNLSRVEVKWVN